MKGFRERERGTVRTTWHDFISSLNGSNEVQIEKAEKQFSKFCCERTSWGYVLIKLCNYEIEQELNEEEWIGNGGICHSLIDNMKQRTRGIITFTC